jgi:hypothetical protein
VTKHGTHVEGEVALTAGVRKLVGGTAASALKAAKEVSERLSTDFYVLGGILLEIKQKGYYETVTGEDGEHLSGQPGFESYIKQELGIEYRMAMHYMSIYEVLTTAGITESNIKGMKWTKLAQLLGLITAGAIDKSNWGEWAQKVKTLKGDAFKEVVDSAMVEAGIERKAARGPTSNKKRFSIVLFDDRADVFEKALDLARSKMPPREDGVGISVSEAIDYIVSEWLTMASSEE